MSELIRTAAIAVTAAAFFLYAAASFLASGNGRWVAAGAAVIDTRAGRVCALDANRVGFCDDYAGFPANR